MVRESGGRIATPELRHRSTIFVVLALRFSCAGHHRTVPGSGAGPGRSPVRPLCPSPCPQLLPGSQMARPGAPTQLALAGLEPRPGTTLPGSRIVASGHLPAPTAVTASPDASASFLPLPHVRANGFSRGPCVAPAPTCRNPPLPSVRSPSPELPGNGYTASHGIGARIPIRPATRP
jgi:hypothetical protein